MLYGTKRTQVWCTEYSTHTPHSTGLPQLPTHSRWYSSTVLYVRLLTFCGNIFSSFSFSSISPRLDELLETRHRVKGDGTEGRISGKGGKSKIDAKGNISNNDGSER